MVTPKVERYSIETLKYVYDNVNSKQVNLIILILQLKYFCLTNFNWFSLVYSIANEWSLTQLPSSPSRWRSRIRSDRGQVLSEPSGNIFQIRTCKQYSKKASLQINSWISSKLIQQMNIKFCSIGADGEILDDQELPDEAGLDNVWGGIPAKNHRGENLLLFIGIIDILQEYGVAKKVEHYWKSLIHDGDTVSVHRPSFYARRFKQFMGEKVFRKMAAPIRYSRLFFV